ncbi:MAG: class I SAM-dependent methyltransferase [Verrucomicrobiota bacterium]
MTNPSIENQESFYNKRWQEFSFAHQRKLLRCAAILSALGETKLSEPRIVDLGCGAGWLANILGVFGPTVGIELSSTAINEASKRYPHVQFINSNVFEWDYSPGEFDVVVSQEVIEHVEDQVGYLRIAHDLLRNGGYLILTTPNARVASAMEEDVQTSIREQPIEKWLTVETLKSMLLQQFELLRITTIVPTSGNKGLHRWLSSLRLRRLCERLGIGQWLTGCQLWFGYGLHSIAVARKGT